MVLGSVDTEPPSKKQRTDDASEPEEELKAGKGPASRSVWNNGPTGKARRVRKESVHYLVQFLFSLFYLKLGERREAQSPMSHKIGPNSPQQAS